MTPISAILPPLSNLYGVNSGPYSRLNRDAAPTTPYFGGKIGQDAIALPTRIDFVTPDMVL